MTLIDDLYLGLLDVNSVNLNFDHFKQRLNDNRISFDFVKNLLFNEEMLDYCKSEHHKDGWDLFYPAPKTKSYNQLKICVKIFDNRINVMTLYGS